MKITSRRQLPAFLMAHGLCGTGAELGVAGGGFSNHLLANTPIERLYSIDRWAGDRGHSVEQYRNVCLRLSSFGSRSVVFRASFEEALVCFENESLDFVYIDGYAHEGNENGSTLELWWPKLRKGGLFAGHDYAPKFPENQRAVDQFRTQFSPETPLQLTEADRFPSWLIVK